MNHRSAIEAAQQSLNSSSMNHRVVVRSCALCRLCGCGPLDACRELRWMQTEARLSGRGSAGGGADGGAWRHVCDAELHASWRGRCNGARGEWRTGRSGRLTVFGGRSWQRVTGASLGASMLTLRSAAAATLSEAIAPGGMLWRAGVRNASRLGTRPFSCFYGSGRGGEGGVRFRCRRVALIESCILDARSTVLAALAHAARGRALSAVEARGRCSCGGVPIVDVSCVFLQHIRD